MSWPLDVLSIVGLVAGVRPVCIQCRRVFVDEVLVGISRSIMMTAYDVPVNRAVVPTRGCVAVTRHRASGFGIFTFMTFAQTFFGQDCSVERGDARELYDEVAVRSRLETCGSLRQASR
jgi:hypothetical protein